MRIVAISDTHNQHEAIEVGSGDILIHAGDATGMGYKYELKDFIEWFAKQDFKYKIYIPGNHDCGLEKEYRKRSQWFKDAGIIILNEESVSIDGVKIYGSPITPEFGNWAFTRKRGSQIKENWDNIPMDTDILITHGPPQGILDEISNYFQHGGTHAGCEELLKRVKEVKPRYHVFGHIHEDHGEITIDLTTFVNASQLNERYMHAFDPVEIKGF